MTWGQQNTEAEAHAQLDMALDVGVNFIDTAEMYPVPPRQQTYGDTERCIGTWLKARGNRDKVIIASKVVGPAADWFPWIRDRETRLDRENIETAVNHSLQRLQTDYIDLYQLHWPDRSTNYFGKLGYEHLPEEVSVPIRETLEILSDLIIAGKIRHVGISNETPWGAMRFIHHAEQGLPRVVSIQNPYNLLNRTFEVGLAEVAHREDVGLLAYSPLAFGVLSGKYCGGLKPEGARLTLFERYTRYSNEQSESATEAYVELAKTNSLTPARMALAYVNSRPFLTSTIVGATTREQLRENLESVDADLSEEVLAGIEAIHKRYSNPCP